MSQIWHFLFWQYINTLLRKLYTKKEKNRHQAVFEKSNFLSGKLTMDDDDDGRISIIKAPLPSGWRS